jgi:hypothetical protein
MKKENVRDWMTRDPLTIDPLVITHKYRLLWEMGIVRRRPGWRP